jgi:hypothetical protein
MKFGTGMLLGAALGYAAATWLRKADPAVVTGPTSRRPPQSAAGTLMSEGSRRLVDRAQAAGLEALQRARDNIQARIGDDAGAAWN